MILRRDLKMDRSKATQFFKGFSSNMYSKIIVVVLVSALLCQNVFLMKSNASVGFKDIKSTDWFYQNVADLIKDSRGIIKGYPDGTFKPQGKLTKDQFITMVVRAAGFNLPNAEEYWAQNNINKAIELRFIYKGEFINFDEAITREEMSLIITRVVNYIDGPQTYTELEQVEQVVLDEADFGKAYRSDILKTYKLGIITGYNDNTFRPQGILTRSEASAVIIRVIKPSSRIPFDYDELYTKVHGDIQSHLLGGSKWVDPTKATNLVNAKEDWLIIKSELMYYPSQKDFDLGLVSKMSIDYVMGAIVYDKEGALPGQVDDFKTLLKRRMPIKEVNKIMEYVYEKKNSFTYMEHAEVVFILDSGRYLVRIFEDIQFEGMKDEQAMDIQFNIAYRSSDFINDYEQQFLRTTNDHDKIVIR